MSVRKIPIWNVHVRHVKGEGSWGEERDVPINPDSYPILKHYMKLLKEWLKINGVNYRILFAGINGSKTGELSSNRIRSIKKIVEDEVGCSFPLQICRRTYGQRLSDSNADIESVSVVLGHATTKTTEGYYCRKNTRKAIDNIAKVWS